MVELQADLSQVEQRMCCEKEQEVDKWPRIQNWTPAPLLPLLLTQGSGSELTRGFFSRSMKTRPKGNCWNGFDAEELVSHETLLPSRF